VTVVGGTTGFWPETGAELSAGGFSNYFPTASFQKTQVAAYLKTMGKKQYAGLYNTSGRAYPDVAAQAQNIATYNTGFFTPVDGTSCSSPIFASIVGLLNDLLLKVTEILHPVFFAVLIRFLQAGKSPLGWMNPFIYAK
jgi:tripeptidyl-peptidase-1